MRPYRSSPTVHQFLLRSGRPLLPRHELRRPPPTRAGHRGDDGARLRVSRTRRGKSDRIVAIALADSAGFHRPSCPGRTCRKRSCSPCCGSSAARSRHHRGARYLPLRPRVRRGARSAFIRSRSGGAAGRAPLRGLTSRMQVADRSITYRRSAVRGTTSSTRRFSRELSTSPRGISSSFGLRTSPRHFGVASRSARTCPGGDPRIFREGRARLMACARDDVTETLSPCPRSCRRRLRPGAGPAVRLPDGGARGDATKIDALLLREISASRPRRAAPQRPGSAGGCTAVFTGRGRGRPARRHHLALPSLDAQSASPPGRGCSGSLRIAARRPRPSALPPGPGARGRRADTDRALLGGLQQDRSSLHRLPSTALSASRRATGTTSTPPTA